MSILIEELKKEHAVIVDTLNTVKELGINTKEGQEKLLAARTAFLAHLEKEDEKLYPVLKKAAENDEELKENLNNFAKNIKKVSKIALYFFDRYSCGGSGFEFRLDFERLYESLKFRILNEEIILYKEYEKLRQ